MIVSAFNNSQVFELKEIALKINRHIFAVYALCAAGANSCAPGAPPVQKQSSQTKNNEKPKNQADSEIFVEEMQMSYV